MANNTEPQGIGIGAGIFLVAVAVSLWQLLVVLLLVGMLVLLVRYSRAQARLPVAEPAFEPWPEVAQNPEPKPRTKRGPKPKPKPAGLEYQPRWTGDRRKDAKRELKQWQKTFDYYSQV